MLTFYCPNCWTALEENTRKCPHCGYEIDNFESSSYEDKLLAALHHLVPERRVMAAQILGNLGSHRALTEFKNIIRTESDYFFLRAVLIACAKIDSPERLQILQLATEHESKLVRDLAVELFNQLSSGQEHGQWDRHTG